MSDISNIN